MTAHSWIKPVSDINRAIGSHHHVRGPEARLEVFIDLAALEVRACELAFLVRGQEIKPLQLEPSAFGLGIKTKDRVAARFTGEEQAAMFLPQRAVLVERHTRRRTAAIHIAGRRGSGILLPPLRGRRVLSGPAICAPTALAVQGAESHVRVLHQPCRAARGRIVVVSVKHVSKGGDRLLVAVAEVLANDVNARAVGIHPRCETADIDMPVVTFLTGDLPRIPAHVAGILPAVVRIVIAADAKGLARLVGEHGAAVARVPIPLPVRPDRDRVQRMIVNAAVEPRQPHLALVHGGIKLQIAIHVGVNDQVRRHRNDNLVVDDRDAHRRAEEGFLHERPALVRPAIAVRVFEDMMRSPSGWRS